MNFELGKEYIVRVTEKGIIPIDEFDRARFFDKDCDSLEFLTDEEKAEVINEVLNGMILSILVGIFSSIGLSPMLPLVMPHSIASS